MSSDESDYEGNTSDLPFWNNWKPNRKSPPKCCEVKTPQTDKQKNNTLVYTKSFARHQVNVIDTSRYKNWIPPKGFGVGKRDFESLKLAKKRRNVQEPEEFEKKVLKSPLVQCCDRKPSTSKEISNQWNADWGERKELHDVTDLSDGELCWGLIEPGIFEFLKIWINDYGHVCASAEGKVMKKGNGEETVITITTPDLLRKLLNVTCSQWTSLTESLEQERHTLKYNALEDCNISKMVPLEKLWYFLCKRRHFLPAVCIRVQLSGAVKVMKIFRVLPRLVVQDIRTYDGKEFD